MMSATMSTTRRRCCNDNNYLIIILIIITSNLMNEKVVNCRKVYGDCQNVNKYFCMGIKGNNGAFYGQGCIKDRNCEAVVRGERKGGGRYVWDLTRIAPAEFDLIRFSLILSDNPAIDGDDVPVRNIALQMTTTHTQSNVYYRQAGGSHYDLDTTQAQVREGMFQPSGCSSDTSSEISTVRINVCPFDSPANIRLAAPGENRVVGINVEGAVNPVLIVKRKDGSVSSHKGSRQYRLFEEAPHDPSFRPGSIRTTIPTQATRAVAKDKDNGGKSLTWLWVLLAILGLIIVGILIYLCCCRKKKDEEITPKTVTATSTTPSKAEGSTAPSQSGKSSASGATPSAAEKGMSKTGSKASGVTGSKTGSKAVTSGTASGATSQQTGQIPMSGSGVKSKTNSATAGGSRASAPTSGQPPAASTGSGKPLYVPKGNDYISKSAVGTSSSPKSGKLSATPHGSSSPGTTSSSGGSPTKSNP